MPADRAKPSSQAVQLIQSMQDAGVDIFNFAIFPEGEAMQHYNRLHPDACVTKYTSKGVWAEGSSLKILEEFASKIHPGDFNHISDYIQQHLQQASQGIPSDQAKNYSSKRFRIRSGDHEPWRWQEIRSRLFQHDPELVICEGLFSDVTELMESLLTDPLTGLANQRGAELKLQDLNSREPQTSLNLIQLAIDRFDTIESCLGFNYANTILQQAASELDRHKPANAFLAKLEQASFLIIIPGELAAEQTSANSRQQLESEAKRLQRLLSANFYDNTEQSLHLTVSAGLAITASHSSLHAATLIQQSHTALITAKQSGAGGLAHFDANITEQIKSRLTIENRLEDAIRRNCMQLAYQPQYDNQGRIIGAEALIRWRDDAGRWIPPNTFISVAEQTGQIQAIGQQIFAQACKDMQQFQSLGLRQMAINVSPVQLTNSGLREPILHLLKTLCLRHGLRPEQLELELTETALIQQPDECIQQLQILTQAGFRLALDDFGTGYSSLQLLQRLPIHKIKIDKSFITHITTSSRDQALVEMTAFICQRLDLEWLAEGVETEEQRQALSKRGCQAFQGYLFSRPVSAADLLSLLQTTAAGSRA